MRHRTATDVPGSPIAVQGLSFHSRPERAFCNVPSTSHERDTTETNKNKQNVFFSPSPRLVLPRCCAFKHHLLSHSNVYLSSSPESVPTGLWHKNSQHLTQSELVPSWGKLVGGGGKLAGLSMACLSTEHKRLQAGFSPETLSSLFPVFLLLKR